jgi:hypothetical protein
MGGNGGAHVRWRVQRKAGKSRGTGRYSARAAKKRKTSCSGGQCLSSVRGEDGAAEREMAGRWMLGEGDVGSEEGSVMCVYLGVYNKVKRS